MSDLIQLLPDSVANQIAAGEVVQRPASVLKELVENSIDAGSSKIQIVLKDAGKTLIQVIDNGCGMSETDARMCFERHATSKIRKAMDLFNIKTMGFRGEAMASIAAIAHVQLKSKKHDADIGTLIDIAGSKVEKQEPTTCPNGTSISVKNLFFNVPARRKFLSSNSTELKHLLEYFQRIALGFPEIEMQLIHNDSTMYNLPISNTKQRIINLLGKQTEKNLIPIKSETSIAKIHGYIGKPEHAKKRGGDQFFFVNKRFMKHPYFFKAVMNAYQNILPNNMFPMFFIYFDINPDAIDINIHPTKTEIKFEDEKALWPIVEATVKEGLGKFNIAPSIDFEQDDVFEIPSANISSAPQIQTPQININPNYNPFNENTYKPKPTNHNYKPKQNTDSWEKLYADFDKNANAEKNNLYSAHNTEEKSILPNDDILNNKFFQIKGKYIAVVVKSGLMLIDQKRAHERILYDEYINKKDNAKYVGQELLYPEVIELETIDAELLRSSLSEINNLGFTINELEENKFEVKAIPADFPNKDIKEWLSEIIDNIRDNQQDLKQYLRENVVKTLAKFLSIPYGKTLSNTEMSVINNKLFSSSMPNITPNGKTIVTIISTEEIEKHFNV